MADFIPNGTTDYIWQGSQVMEERNSSNSPTRQYVWGNYPGAAALTGPWAQTGFRPQNSGLGSLNADECVQLTTLTTLGPQSLPAGAYYLLQDLLYRAVALTKSIGTVVEAYDCDAYGNTQTFTAPGTDGIWFTDDDVQSAYGANEIIYSGYPDHSVVMMVIGTGLYDPETGLDYVRNRTYNPVLGRWVQRDPIGFAGGVNLYEYVGGRAVADRDPSGLDGVVWPADGQGGQVWGANPFPNTIPLPPGIAQDLITTTPLGFLYQQYQQDQGLANYWFGQLLKLSPGGPGYANASQQWSKYRKASNYLLGQISDQLEQGMGGQCPPPGGGGPNWDEIANWSQGIGLGLTFLNVDLEGLAPLVLPPLAL